jgi:hypothetical protein
MSLRKLDDLEYIENRLLEIRAITNLEDAYYICDSIITNFNDELLNDHIAEMMKVMGYEKEKIKQVIKIIKNIQNKK